MVSYVFSIRIDSDIENGVRGHCAGAYTRGDMGRDLFYGSPMDVCYKLTIL